LAGVKKTVCGALRGPYYKEGKTTSLYKSYIIVIQHVLKLFTVW